MVFASSTCEVSVIMTCSFMFPILCGRCKLLVQWNWNGKSLGAACIMHPTILPVHCIGVQKPTHGVTHDTYYANTVSRNHPNGILKLEDDLFLSSLPS